MNSRTSRLLRVRIGVLALILLSCPAAMALAEDGWDVTLGAGVYRSAVYTGSDDYYYAPIPIVHTAYTQGDVSFALSVLDGLSVSYASGDTGLTGSLALTYGQERDSEEYSILGIAKDHSERTRRLLEDTPTATAALSAKALLGYRTRLGTLGAAVEFYPTTVEYDGRDDVDYAGFLYGLSYAIERPLTEKLSFTVMAAVEFMDQEYADAWYTVEQPTQALDAFAADAGLRDAKFSLQLTRMFSPHAGVSLVGAGTILLQDAKNSPYTVENFQPTMMFYTFYHF